MNLKEYNVISNSTLLSKVLTCVLAIGMVATSGAALAANTKVYSGSTCVPSRKDDTNTSLFTDAGSSIRHQADNFTSVECPIVRENVGSKAGFKAVVRVSNETKCAIRSFDATGEGIIASDTASSPLNGGDQELTMKVKAGAVDGPYTLSCSMGAFSNIWKYTITERK